MPWSDTEARTHVGRVETLLGALGALPHDIARTRATETVEALVDLYGECLARLMDHLARHPAAAGLASEVAADELVGHLLLVHDLHPLPTEQRIEQALEEAGGGARLLALDHGTARIALPAEGGCGCGSTAAARTAAVEAAVRRLAPEVERVETVQETAAARPLIPVDALFAGPR